MLNCELQLQLQLARRVLYYPSDGWLMKENVRDWWANHIIPRGKTLLAIQIAIYYAEKCT